MNEWMNEWMNKIINQLINDLEMNQIILSSRIQTEHATSRSQRLSAIPNNTESLWVGGVETFNLFNTWFGARVELREPRQATLTISLPKM